MTIVLPIVIAAVIMGLFSQKVTVRHWIILSIWIMMVIMYNYLKRAT
jgi:hypothetical protein